MTRKNRSIYAALRPIVEAQRAVRDQEQWIGSRDYSKYPNAIEICAADLERLNDLRTALRAARSGRQP
jgi:hypothetical protein